jgi:hypothetical protein
MGNFHEGEACTLTGPKMGPRSLLRRGESAPLAGTLLHPRPASGTFRIFYVLICFRIAST